MGETARVPVLLLVYHGNVVLMDEGRPSHLSPEGTQTMRERASRDLRKRHSQGELQNVMSWAHDDS